MGRFLRAFAQRQDLALVALLMMIIFMIILPLPTWLIDALIALNLSIVVLILIVTVYLDNPTKFSTLPAILLFSTLFRLAISISTTRLILVQADAGRIVETFGAFVVGGNMIVGIVVFLIITVVQFVVTSDTSTDLGSDIAEQISGNPRALQISAVVLVILGLVPGFPMLTFFALAFALGALGLWMEFAFKRKEQEDLETAEQDNRNDISMTPMSAVHMALGDDLAAQIDKDAFLREALLERARLFEQLGVPFPPVHVTRSGDSGHSWALLIEGVPVADGTLPLDSLRIVDDPENASILVAFQTSERVLAMVAGVLLPRHAKDFLGVHETNLILSALENRYDELVKEAQKALPLQKIAQIFRRLVEEDVSVRNTRIVLETIVEWAGREKEEQSRSLLTKVRDAIGSLSEHRSPPVILTAMDVRRFLRNFLDEHGVDCPIMSFKEVAPQYQVQPLAVLSMR